MAKFYPELNEKLGKFIAAQPMFFVATAPAEGRINLSPKGMDTFRCLDHKTVAYLDLVGSGNETAAHIAENGRLTMMFCSFDDKPLVVRLSGRARVIHQRDTDWAELYSCFEPYPNARQIIVLDIALVQTSCGFGVPVFEFKRRRTNMSEWAEQRGEAGLIRYQRQHNQKSIDGLPTKLFED
ncbi:MAG: pyridoxamine 5'-phosphate oxidase family protein [Anaerolineales bacterium]|nr:pyridoxamine 5'-phosphate oxidase family protein [Anaerolineales bacterium]